MIYSDYSFTCSKLLVGAASPRLVPKIAVLHVCELEGVCLLKHTQDIKDSQGPTLSEQQR